MYPHFAHSEPGEHPTALGVKRGEKAKVVGRVENGKLVITPLKKMQGQSQSTL